MSLDVLLLVLRLISAALLLTFMGVIGWLIYRDVQLTTTALAERTRIQGHLLVLDGGEDLAPGTRFPILAITSIGRANTNTIVLDDAYASAEHALILRRGSQWWLEDLESRNGTLLNDLPLTEMAIVSAGDIVTIGDTRLKLEF